MMEIQDFCNLIDSERPEEPDYLEVLKDIGKIPRDMQLEDLTNIQLGWLKREEEKFHANYRKKWANIILKNIRYKKPFIVNADLAWKAQARRENVFVLPIFSKPGKNCFAVKRYDEVTNREELIVQTYIVGGRDEPVPPFAKISKLKRVQRKFDYESSVFAKWRPDDPQTYRNIFDHHDFYRWKVGRFIKSENELDQLKEFFREHAPQFKELYANLQSQSTLYPGISQLTFSDFCQDAKLIDNKFNLSTCDRLFIAANYVMDQSINQGQNTVNDLIRFEFMEILVRLVKAKYVDTDSFPSIYEALTHLFNEVLPQYTLVSWQKWRDDELWTLEINDLFQFNLEHLKAIYNKFSHKKLKKMFYNNVLDLFSTMNKEKTECHHVEGLEDLAGQYRITERQCRFCFGMAKMTICHEEYEEERYNSLLFVEFLEMIGRVAVIKYQGTELDEEPLVTKIGYILDSMIVSNLGNERNLVEIPEIDISESDQDY